MSALAVGVHERRSDADCRCATGRASAHREPGDWCPPSTERQGAALAYARRGVHAPRARRVARACRAHGLFCALCIARSASNALRSFETCALLTETTRFLLEHIRRRKSAEKKVRDQIEGQIKDQMPHLVRRSFGQMQGANRPFALEKKGASRPEPFCALRRNFRKSTNAIRSSALLCH